MKTMLRSCRLVMRPPQKVACVQPRCLRRPFTSANSTCGALSIPARPKGFKLGFTSDAIEHNLPFTNDVMVDLWGLLHNNIGVVSVSPQPPDEKANVRQWADSYLEILLPLSSSHHLRQSLIRSDNKTVRFGKLFEILDALAADIAYRHCHANVNGPPLKVVTAAVDEMRAFLSNLSVYEDLRLQGYLTYVGSSSMEVTINLLSISEGSGEEKLYGSMHFIMVARTADSWKAARVFGLAHLTPAQMEEFDRGAARAARRKANVSSSLHLLPPKLEEIQLIHELHTRVKKLQLQEHGEGGAESLSGQSSRGFQYMNQTVLKNTKLMFHQNKNKHGNIFGGYLMRTSFELAYITAMCFSREGHKDCGVTFHSIDDIQFLRPVNIGAIMEFVGMVLYVKDTIMVIQVSVSEFDPKTGNRVITNRLNYVFQSRKHKLQDVIPREYEEFLLYINGKRTFDYLIENKSSSDITL